MYMTFHFNIKPLIMKEREGDLSWTLRQNQETSSIIKMLSGPEKDLLLKYS